MSSAKDRNLKFATLIRETREKAGLTQQELADRLLQPQSYISKIERSERRLTLVDLELIAEALNTSVIALLTPLYMVKKRL